MTKEKITEPFDAATEKVEQAHREAVDQLRAKVAGAKAEALKKISS